MEQLDFALYNGDIAVEFDEATHRYRITDRGTQAFPTSVTTFLGAVSKGPGLTQWAVNQAIDTLQARLFSGDEHSAEDIEIYLNEARYAHRTAVNDAATVGTLAHNWLEDYWKHRIYGSPMPELPDNPLAINCINAAQKWIAEVNPEPIFIERPLYSRKYNAIGRADMYAKFGGKRVLCDWKSSTGLYDTYYFQTGAYSKFYEEETGELPDERCLIKLGKYDGEFEAKRIVGGIEEDYRAFLGAVEIYRRQRQLGRRS